MLNRKNKINKIVLSIILLLTVGGAYFYFSKKSDGSTIDLESSPVLSAVESMSRMQIEDGFEVKLVASEPLISTPVAFTFDEIGRIWAVEMNGYMPDTLGTGEDIPNGKIVILEDKNKDGVMDVRKVFLDSLVMPRAVCLYAKGVLVAEPPNLWYYEINKDKPGKKVLVDGNYTEGGNVEHYPNGLLLAMDNWIYNAKSNKRYRKKGDKWLIEKTSFRGQWGLSQDNYGRLFYNNNSQNLLGDYFSPGFGAGNKNQKEVAGYNETIVADNRVYPLRPNTGVNRGYLPGILDTATKQLINFTAACAPLVYRSNAFGMNYESNVFVAEPAANLIKRNIINDSSNVVNGKQAYQEKEFLASTDERFRPVNIYNGPNGALYVADMYRGIIQHKTYLTPYLRNQIKRRDLSVPLNYGRIYKIVRKNNTQNSISFSNNPLQLVKLLGHSDGWVRDMAQQLLISHNFPQAIPALKAAMKQTSNPLHVIHSMWTLEGLGVLANEDVLPLLKQQSWPIRMQALTILPSVLNSTSYKTVLPILEKMVDQNDTLAAPYIAYLVKFIQLYDQSAARILLKKVALKYANNNYVADAVISNLEDREESFQNEIEPLISDTSVAIFRKLKKVISDAKKANDNHDEATLKKEFPKGYALFNSTCQTCHGIDGNGVKSLAPPLNKSQWVTGDKEKLISIVLLGLTGPIEVNDHFYKAPEINGDMPAIGFDKQITDEQVAEVLSFIRKSWQNNSEKVSTLEVAKIRQKLKGRQKSFTAEELK
ncbi:mono/diheme cytochrome c family protein/glucose/arabinose dehydrogenase [Pedobacter sp. UYEF25]